MVYPTTNYTMSIIKQYLLQQQEEEQELWESYWEFCKENKELFQQLPVIIEEEVEYEL